MARLDRPPGRAAVTGDARGGPAAWPPGQGRAVELDRSGTPAGRRAVPGLVPAQIRPGDVLCWRAEWRVVRAIKPDFDFDADLGTGRWGLLRIEFEPVHGASDAARVNWTSRRTVWRA